MLSGAPALGAPLHQWLKHSIRKGVRRVNTKHLPDSNPNEAGFGLIEIMVSMFLLALLATAFLPLLIQAMRTSVMNASVATANQLASAQLDELRTLDPYCDTVSAFDDVTPASVTDTRGTVYQPSRAVAACPSVYPGVIEVTVSVARAGEPSSLARARTLVYLESATAPTP